MNKIILLGYMGSGKSTIGALLAKKLHLPFQDLDLVIENIEKKTIPSLFKEKGELYFRKRENEILKQLLQASDGFVLSLGGGTPCYANNHELLQDPTVISVYLNLSVAELTRRLSKNKAKRPLIAALDSEELKAFVGQHLLERNYFYRFAKHTLNCDGKSKEEVVQAIAELLL